MVSVIKGSLRWSGRFFEFIQKQHSSIQKKGKASHFLDRTGGGGAKLNREIVSCRACVRAVCMCSEIGVKIYGALLLLFFFAWGGFTFSFPRPQTPIQLLPALSVKFILFGIVYMFPRFVRIWGSKMPTCQSFRIAVWSLSGAFASVPPRRVSMDDLVFSSYSPMATPIIDRDNQKVDLEVHFQHPFLFLKYGVRIGIGSPTQDSLVYWEGPTKQG